MMNPGDPVRIIIDQSANPPLFWKGIFQSYDSLSGCCEVTEAPSVTHSFTRVVHVSKVQKVTALDLIAEELSKPCEFCGDTLKICAALRARKGGNCGCGCSVCPFFQDCPECKPGA